MGKFLIVVGVSIALVGVLYSYFPGTINWFGRLPGDIRIEKENSKFFFPITSMIVLSILFSIVMRLLRNFNG